MVTGRVDRPEEPGLALDLGAGGRLELQLLVGAAKTQAADRIGPRDTAGLIGRARREVAVVPFAGQCSVKRTVDVRD